jgi:hypothetical protein
MKIFSYGELGICGAIASLALWQGDEKLIFFVLRKIVEKKREKQRNFLRNCLEVPVNDVTGRFLVNLKQFPSRFL